MTKRIAFIIALSVLVSLLSGCVGLAPKSPESITDGKITYKTGFYGSLFPNVFEYSGDSVKAENITLNKIVHDKFVLYHADVGSYVEGTIYCDEKDYDNVQSYYDNPENYSYYCILGVDSETQNTKAIEIADVDTDKFYDLLTFAEDNTYDPFDKEHNSNIEQITLPMPDDDANTRIVFYKESLDSLFVSTTGNEYYIIDNQLYLVYRYDFGHGEYEELIAVKIPDEISRYFVEYLKPLL